MDGRFEAGGDQGGTIRLAVIKGCPSVSHLAVTATSPLVLRKNGEDWFLPNWQCFFLILPVFPKDKWGGGIRASE
jgi:hypothetical protein